MNCLKRQFFYLKRIPGMPLKAKRYCMKCSSIATNGVYCDEHAPKRNYREENSRRSNCWDSWYKTSIWQEKRLRQLKREPICRECRNVGIYTKATEADHIKPHKGDWSLFIDESNLQSLCKRCHSQKTAKENSIFNR